MIRHTILFKPKHNVPKPEVEDVFSKVLDLAEALSGILTITGGTCYFDDKKSDLFSHGFSIDFEDSEALLRFSQHPLTHTVKKQIAELSEGGSQGVMEFDFGRSKH